LLLTQSGSRRRSCRAFSSAFYRVTISLCCAAKLCRGIMSQTNVAATAARQATADEPVPAQAEIAAKHPAMRAVEALAEALIVLTLLGELLLVLANVFARVYLQRSFLWSDEAARLSLSILAFIGGAVAYRRRDHAFVRVLLDRAAPALERACL